MKLYFLLEGVGSEMQAYPNWVSELLPEISTYSCTEDFELFKANDNSSYFISGEGYPNLLDRIDNAIIDIESVGNVDYFFVILDSDEDQIEDRYQAVLEQCQNSDLSRDVKLCIIVQKRCFETLVLGNQKYIPRNPEPNPKPNMESYWDLFQYYNVHTNDPEDMGHYNDSYTHSQFHAHYAKKALWEKRIIYSKGKIGIIGSGDYIRGIEKRVNDTGHLESIHPLFDFIYEIQEKLTA
ncbi:hypothetical protein PQE20_03945 [Vibrio harveyi]|uniref:hypothetical protein n=1 Tax=Vibrio harveyi TaxID=669 RepID=UPI00234DA160|nr:hypothetical protein [Vibrio harveyi]WCP81158.1 hypothetical protein PQE20_03945 [Vibrio harveyi]